MRAAHRPMTRPFHAKDTSILNPSVMVSIETPRGKGTETLNSLWIKWFGVYVIDPPLGSFALGSKGSRSKSGGPGAGNAYYEGGTPDGSDAHRSTLRPETEGGSTSSTWMVTPKPSSLKKAGWPGSQRIRDPTQRSLEWHGRSAPALNTDLPGKRPAICRGSAGSPGWPRWALRQ